MTESGVQSDYDGVEFWLAKGLTLEDVVIDPGKSAGDRRSALGRICDTLVGTPAGRRSILNFIADFGLLDDPCEDVASLARGYASVLPKSEPTPLTRAKMLIRLDAGQTLKDVIIDPGKPWEVRHVALSWLYVTRLGTPAGRKSVLDFIADSALMDDPCGEVAGPAISYAYSLSTSEDNLVTQEKLLAFLEDSRPLVQLEAAIALHSTGCRDLPNLVHGWLDMYSPGDLRHSFALEIDCGGGGSLGEEPKVDTGEWH